MATQPVYGSTMPVPGGGIRLKPEGPLPKDPGQAPRGPVGPRPPSPPPLQPVAPTPSETTAAPDPGMTDVAKMTREYIAGIPGAVGHTTDVAGSKIRDSYEGVYRQNAARASQRGVTGTGVHGVMDSGTDDEQLRALAGSATDIAEEGHRTAGTMLQQLSQQEAARAGLQQNQQQIGLQQRAADLAAQRQMQEQLEALGELYQDRQPRSYYDDTDPETVTPTGGGGTGGGWNPGGRVGPQPIAGGGTGPMRTAQATRRAPPPPATYSDLGAGHPFAGVR